MIERLQTICDVGLQDAKRYMRRQRMLILSPLIILTISMACWGFADARIVPAGLPTNTPSEVLFYSSLPIVFFCSRPEQHVALRIGHNFGGIECLTNVFDELGSVRLDDGFGTS